MAKTCFIVCHFFAVCFLVADGKELLCRQLADGKELADGKLADSSSDYGRWMDIVRSLELESCILTKLTKPSVPVNLVGPQVSLSPRWVPASRGVFIFCA